MISFTIITSDPPALRAALLARGVLTATGPRLGAEIAELQPYTITPGTITTPPVVDTRRIFLVKFAHAAEADEIAEEVQFNADGTRRAFTAATKLGKWILANSVADTVFGMAARKIGTAHWFIREQDAAPLGVWQ